MILQKLNMHGRVTVNELAEQLNVSKVTIRRDLEKLSQEKKLTIVHGGAIKPNFTLYEEPFINRREVNLEEKKRVGQAASSFINDNDVIAFGVGTTTLQVATHLQNKKNLTIIVGCVSILNVLIEQKRLGYFTGRIIFIGGEIDTEQMFVSGTLTMEILDKLNIDKAFIGANGYSVKHGLTTFLMDEGNLLKKIIKHSNEAYLVIDHSKLEAKSFYQYAEFDDVHCVICDYDPPNDWKKHLASREIRWVKA